MWCSRSVFVCLLGFSLPWHPAAAQTMAEATACLSSLYNSPQAAPLQHRVLLNPLNATPAQLSDRSYPTPSEIAALRAVYPGFRDCRLQAMAVLSRTMPGLVPVAQRLVAAGDEDLRLLMQQRLSWGEASTRHRDRALILQGEMQQLPEYRAGQAAQAQRQQQQQAAREALLREQASRAAQTGGSGSRPCVAESHGNAFGALAMALAPCPPGTPTPYQDALERQMRQELLIQQNQALQSQGAVATYRCQQNGRGYNCQP